MVIRKRYRYSYWPFMMCVILVLSFSCGSRAKYAGIYQTEEADEEKRSELELKENGEGYWRVGENEESFTWHPKKNEIRLNTRKGGVIIAIPIDDTLEISLISGKKLTFKKIE